MHCAMALACPAATPSGPCRNSRRSACRQRCSASLPEQSQHALTRRAALTSTVLLASLAAPVWAEPEKLEKLKRIAQDGVDNSSSPLVQRLLASSTANKEKYTKDRLDSYYRRNLRDYFDNPGNLRGLSPETKQKIADWLRQNPA